jgi:hypothetical protein
VEARILDGESNGSNASNALGASINSYKKTALFAAYRGKRILIRIPNQRTRIRPFGGTDKYN